MQLQLPFLTLTNSYLALLTHSFWPGENKSVAPTEGRDDDYEAAYDEDSRNQGLLADDDD